MRSICLSISASSKLSKYCKSKIRQIWRGWSRAVVYYAPKHFLLKAKWVIPPSPSFYPPRRWSSMTLLENVGFLEMPRRSRKLHEHGAVGRLERPPALRPRCKKRQTTEAWRVLLHNWSKVLILMFCMGPDKFVQVWTMTIYIFTINL